MKIKANNLMIGDLIEVAFHNGEWKCVCVEQIRYIEDSHIIYFVYKDVDGEHHNYISCDDSDEYIRGIEITEDFLKKKRFRRRRIFPSCRRGQQILRILSTRASSDSILRGN